MKTHQYQIKSEMIKIELNIKYTVKTVFSFRTRLGLNTFRSRTYS